MANPISSALDRTGQENGIHWHMRFVRAESAVQLSATYGNVTRTTTYTLLHLPIFGLDTIDANEINQRIEQLITAVATLTTVRP